MNYKVSLLITALAVVCITSLHSQDPARFSKEIMMIGKSNSEKAGEKGNIVFTGSSSIRLWATAGDYFKGKKIINTGFGGSHMSDLLFYIDTVVIKYKPVQVLIYEGDNDIASEKKAEEIIRDAESVVAKIHQSLPETEVIFISAKPSPSRWALRDEYIRLNGMLKKLAEKKDNTGYIDLWSPLLSESGRPRGELYNSDSLHINERGYKIWAAEISKILK